MATINLTGKQLTRRRVVAAKIESVEGTMETITVANAGVLVINPRVDVDIKMYERTVVSGTLTPFPDIPGALGARITFSSELMGSPDGLLYSESNRPALDVYFRACGFAATVTTTGGSEAVLYKPVSTGLETITLWIYADGVTYKFYGCRGNVRFTGNVGEPIIAEFTFQGVYSAVADLSLIAPSYGSAVPPTLLSANSNLVVGSDTINPILRSFETDMGNTLAMREDMRNASGYKSCLITGRRPTGRFDPEMSLVAEYDWYGKWKLGTPAALTIGPIGSTQYNRVTITEPYIVYTKIADADRTGIAVADTSYMCARSSGAGGNDEVQINFT